ncbi:nucleoside 2-deoxyribosyltransferase [Klebsiella phage KPN N98]|uniref:Nucleoside 2-deoxyribosyltransferase n=1 Tax=Klebsiella phage KPN N98 TaxID=2079340 RepID=A0A2K9VK38_9CAUD|nr:nucleoside 2-deoxyribosyltransferase [Klebsiella phage KPN N98]AUV62712.1 nucleoside 2-deoxyribosyltransferase [Klebsiella phage KPN N98]
MKLIYIAGPYRPYTNACGALVDTAHNISIAELTAVHLVDTLGHLGLFPVVPHLNTRDFENQVKQNDDQYFLDGTMAMLERCDAVLLTMPNADVVSTGTKAEVHRAYQLGIQVYRSFDALRRAAQQNQVVRLPIQLILPDRTGLQGMYELLRRNEEETHRRFMQMSPGAGKAWDTDGPLTVHEFSKLEDRVLATLTETPVAAVNLRPGDVLSSGDVVNSTEQLDGLIIKLNWANGTSERYHYAEIFKVVMRRVEGKEC